MAWTRTEIKFDERVQADSLMFSSIASSSSSFWSNFAVGATRCNSSKNEPFTTNSSSGMRSTWHNVLKCLLVKAPFPGTDIKDQNIGAVPLVPLSTKEENPAAIVSTGMTCDTIWQL